MGRTDFDFDAHPSKEELGEAALTIRIYETDGTTPRKEATVIIANETTGKSMQLGTMNGIIITSLDDLERGYTVGDKITVYEVRANSLKHYITPSGNLTRPNWFQIVDSNELEVLGSTPGHSEIRFEVDLTNYPSGRHDLTITEGS